MRRRFFISIILTIFLLTNAGCSYEVFRRKFIRKNKGVVTAYSIYQVEPFVKPSNTEVYSHAFLFWKIWEGELLYALSNSGYPKTTNMLKVKQCLEQSLANLDQMKGLLKDGKVQELDGYIKTLQDFNMILDERSLSDMESSRMRDDIESHKRNVDARFCLNSVKNYIIPDISAGSENISTPQK